MPSRYGFNDKPDVVYSSGKCIHRRLPSDAVFQGSANNSVYLLLADSFLIFSCYKSTTAVATVVIVF